MASKIFCCCCQTSEESSTTIVSHSTRISQQPQPRTFSRSWEGTCGSRREHRTSLTGLRSPQPPPAGTHQISFIPTWDVTQTVHLPVTQSLYRGSTFSFPLSDLNTNPHKNGLQKRYVQHPTNKWMLKACNLRRP
ncbi:testis-expressed protein 53 [Lontra canadensis]|uniref:testis-expressed protein 53 n=1 Tax=Lontra canadensis TaxID=76717 RepID=UPI0013F3094B|nr:testis-expressed protein 53 [Lontra canadensis]